MKKRTLAYTRVRRRRTKPRAPRIHHDPISYEDQTLIFQSGAIEFPIATLRPHDPGSHAHALAGAFVRWFAAQWAWLRPRTVPVMVAAFGLFAVLESANYLRHVKAAPLHYTQLAK
ncbi:MAG: hypothetical protein ABI467_32180 [Kofleriaceae bacterium]